MRQQIANARNLKKKCNDKKKRERGQKQRQLPIAWRSFNYAANAMNRPRTIRRRQPMALIWVSGSFARTRCLRRCTWEHNPGHGSIGMGGRLRHVLGPLVVRSCLPLRLVSRGTKTLPRIGTRSHRPELALRHRFLINNFLPLSEFYPRTRSVSFL